MPDGMSDRLPYNEKSIRENTPRRLTPGVFILCRGLEPRQGWLLVGHDSDVQTALLELLASPPEGLDDDPEYFMWVAVPDHRRAAYANRLVQYMKLQDA